MNCDIDAVSCVHDIMYFAQTNCMKRLCKSSIGSLKYLVEHYMYVNL